MSVKSFGFNSVELLIFFFSRTTIGEFLNTGTSSAPQFASQTAPLNITPPSFVATPVFTDIDTDGDMDLFSMEAYSGIVYYENTSSIGIDEKSKAFDFSIFPNPASDNISITFYNNIVELQLPDMSGWV